METKTFIVEFQIAESNEKFTSHIIATDFRNAMIQLCNEIAFNLENLRAINIFNK